MDRWEDHDVDMTEGFGDECEVVRLGRLKAGRVLIVRCLSEKYSD